MASTYFAILFEEIENDIKVQTKDGYDASDLITLQGLLLYDYSKIADEYYIDNISLDDSVNTRYAIQDLVKKISWALYHGSYREMNWLEEFFKSYEESL